MRIIDFHFQEDSFHASLKSFKQLISALGNPHFDSADLVYDCISHVNPDFPLVLNAHDGRKVRVSGVAINHSDTRANAIIFMLNQAGFGPLNSIAEAVSNEKVLNITIWNDR